MTMLPLVLLMTQLALTVMTAACAVNDHAAGRHREPAATYSTDPQLIHRALAFGGIVLPGGAEVLAAGVDSGIDTRYQLALQMSPSELITLLAESHFDAPFTEAHPPFITVITGPALKSSPRVLRAQDRYRSPTGPSVYRTVIIDERAPEIRIVHLSMFTT